MHVFSSGRRAQSFSIFSGLTAVSVLSSSAVGPRSFCAIQASSRLRSLLSTRNFCNEIAIHWNTLEHSWNNPGTPLDHCWNTPGTPWNTAGTPREHCWNTPGTPWNTVGTPLEHCWNTHGIALNTAGTPLEQCWNTQGPL